MSAVILTVPVVTWAIKVLLQRSIHPVFAGYLCMKRESKRQGRLNDLTPNFWEFFETFFRLPGGPEGKPYYRPFWNQRLSEQKAWYQKNVAGTYAPGSAMRIMSFTQVIEIRDERYSLRDRHWALAKEHILYHNPVPVLPLAVFLYRDFGFDFGSSAGPDHLVSVFREEFGYTIGLGDEEFKHLFSFEETNLKPSLFEKHDLRSVRT